MLTPAADTRGPARAACRKAAADARSAAAPSKKRGFSAAAGVHAASGAIAAASQQQGGKQRRVGGHAAAEEAAAALVEGEAAAEPDLAIAAATPPRRPKYYVCALCSKARAQHAAHAGHDRACIRAPPHTLAFHSVAQQGVAVVVKLSLHCGHTVHHDCNNRRSSTNDQSMCKTYRSAHLHMHHIALGCMRMRQGQLLHGAPATLFYRRSEVVADMLTTTTAPHAHRSTTRTGRWPTTTVQAPSAGSLLCGRRWLFPPPRRRDKWRLAAARQRRGRKGGERRRLGRSMMLRGGGAQRQRG